MYSFSYLEPVCCSMSSSNCCFLTFIQISQEADQVVWCSVVSDSLRPHGLQHARLPCPSQTPRKSESEVSQSCLTLCNPVDYSLPGSSIPGIFQARILEWVAISFSRRFSQPRDGTQVSRVVGRRFTIWATGEVPVSKFNLNVEITDFDYLCKELILKIQLSFNHHRVNKYVLKLNCL